MKRGNWSWASLAAATTAFSMGTAQAVDLKPDGMSAQVGTNGHGVWSVGVDALWDWDWQSRWRRVLFTAQTEFLVSVWRADSYFADRQFLWNGTLLPVLRLRLDEGRSPWFFDGGIGITYMHKLYLTPQNVFGSQWNFYDMLGAGYSYGAQRQHEVELRYVHISNAGLKEPNTGENFLLLRYGHRF